jgi:hypothetical protein
VVIAVNVEFEPVDPGLLLLDDPAPPAPTVTV